MATIWFVLALCLGTMLGFFLFALMAMARSGDTQESRVFAREVGHAARYRVPRTMGASQR